MARYDVAKAYGVKSTIQVDGLNKTIYGLKKYGAEAWDMKTTFRRLGHMALNAARAEAPVRSGKLQRNIRQRIRPNAVYLAVGGKRVPYAKQTHFGSYGVTQPEHPRVQEPNLFMYRAVTKMERPMRNALKTEMRRLTRKYGAPGSG